MKRAIKDLSPQEVFGLAIAVEAGNGRRLRMFAHAFAGYDHAVSARFLELAAEEDQHQALLERRFAAAFGGPVPAVGEFDVAEVVESVDLDDSEHQIFDSLRQATVYRLALTAEHNARNVYLEAARTVSDRGLADFFRELAALEGDHAAWLETRIAAAGAGA